MCSYLENLSTTNFWFKLYLFKRKRSYNLCLNCISFLHVHSISIDGLLTNMLKDCHKFQKSDRHSLWLLSDPKGILFLTFYDFFRKWMASVGVFMYKLYNRKTFSSFWYLQKCFKIALSKLEIWIEFPDVTKPECRRLRENIKDFNSTSNLAIGKLKASRDFKLLL